MALPIRDGNQSLTTLSTIVVSSAHIPAHTVVSLGAQAISDIASSVSGSVVSISNFPASQTTTFGAVTGSVSILNFPASQAVTFSAVSISNFPASQSTTFGAITGSISVLNFPATQAISISSVTIGNSITIGSVPPISGSVTLGSGNQQIGSVTASISGTVPISISSVTIGNFPASQAVTFSAISVSNFPATQPVSLTTLPALVGSTAQIGSVTASISGTVPVSGTFFQATQPVSLASLPSLVAGTSQIGSVTASISGTIPISIASVTIGNSITISSLPALVAGTAQIGSVTVGNSITIGSIVTHGVTIANTSVTVNGTFFQATQPISISSITIGNSVTISSLPAITGTVTANVTTLAFTTQGGIASSNGGSIPTYGIQLGYNNSDGEFALVDFTNGYPITGSVAVKGLDTNDDQTQIAVTTSGSVLASLSSALPTGTNRIGVVTIGGGTVTIGAGTAQIGSVTASISGTVPISISSVTIGNSVTIGSLPAISGTVTANILSLPNDADGFFGDGHQNLHSLFESGSLVVAPISGTVTIGSALPAGTNQIGSVTASISGTVPISISSVTVGNSVTIASLPLISGTVTAMAGGDFGASIENVNDVGNVTKKIAVQLYDESGSAVGISINPLPISGTVTANTFAIQGTAVTTSNFTSTTASTVLANYNATRQVLTIFNEGAGNLHICGGATCTTIAYQVRLSAGDYYEVLNHQTTITHSAVFATAGTARVTQVS